MSEGQKEKQTTILENVSSVLEDVTEDIGKNIDSISKNVSEQMDNNKEQLKKLFNMNSNSGKNEDDSSKKEDDSEDENVKDDSKKSQGEEDDNKVSKEIDTNEDDKDSDDEDQDKDIDEEDQEDEEDEEEEDKDSEDEEEEDEEESESESESEDEEKLQKFDVDMTNNIITNSHPESILHNNDEVQKMSLVSRDNNGIIIDKLHKTIPIMTKFEKTKILGERCKQLQSGSEPFIDIADEGYLDEYLIATRELEAKKIPFIIRRPLPNGGSEYWDIRDLEILY